VTSTTVSRLLLLGLLATSGAEAQTIGGRVVDATGRPIPVALLSLFHEDGRLVRTSLTGEAGEFSLAADAAGRYSLRVERIGYAAQSIPAVHLSGDVDVELPIRFVADPVNLGGILAGAAGTCTGRPDPDSPTGTLWRMIRVALQITTAVDSERLARTIGVRYHRELDGTDLRQTALYSVEGITLAPNAFDPEAVAAGVRDGFATVDADGTVVYDGVSVPALVSQPFLDQHCFGAIVDDPREPGVVGLAFEPVANSDRIGLGGTFWIDRSTAELRSLDFAYQDVAGGPMGRATGHMEFVRLPDGTPVVARWWTRIPSFIDGADPVAASPASFQEDGGVMLDENETTLAPDDGVIAQLTAAIQASQPVAPDSAAINAAINAAIDAAIDAALADILATSTLTSGETVVEGIVINGANGLAVVDAIIAVEREPLRYAARTDQAGRFSFGAIEGGRYQLSVRHDALPGIEQSLEVSGAGTITRLDVVLEPEVRDTGRVIVTIQDVTQVQGITASVRRRPASSTLAVVSERMEFQRRLGLGRLWDRGEIEGSGVNRFADLLVGVPGVRVAGIQVVLNSLLPGCGAPLLYVDGIRYGRASPDESLIPLHLVEALEVYRRPSEIPGEFSGSDAQCGVIAVWTRRGP
jgi:hypothetical protein